MEITDILAAFFISCKLKAASSKQIQNTAMRFRNLKLETRDLKPGIILREPRV